MQTMCLFKLIHSLLDGRDWGFSPVEGGRQQALPGWRNRPSHRVLHQSHKDLQERRQESISCYLQEQISLFPEKGKNLHITILDKTSLLLLAFNSVACFTGKLQQCSIRCHKRYDFMVTL